MKTVFMVILLFAVAMVCGCKPKLEVGQVWISYMNEEDPFLDKVQISRKIDAIKDGWVKYSYWYNDDDEYTWSSTTQADAFCWRGELQRTSGEAAPGITGSMPEEVFCTVADKLIEDPNIIWVDSAVAATFVDTPPVWGQGELPEEYTDFFGNANGARLDYVQNQAIDKHGLILKELARRLLMLEAVDPNE